MGKTVVNTQGEKFLINGTLTYSELPGCVPENRGLLMNARFIQGIFDDRAAPGRFARFGKEEFEPEDNTDALIAALPEWYAHGLRAFTVGLQGGGPVFTIPDLSTIDNNPFGEDGRSFDPAYQGRLDRLIRAADDLGMVVIVSLLYQAQAPRLADGRAVREAVKTACAVLRNGGYTNVIVEVANEHTVGFFQQHPIVFSAEGAAALVDLAREHSGMLVGCSGGGGEVNREVSEASDVILVHGNGCTRQQFFNMIKKARRWQLNKPIVCNEDSQCIGQLAVCFANGVSWGYYNNLTKQEPPADWRITAGEDRFFSRRMAAALGIELPELPLEDQFYLQGFEPQMHVGRKRWIRLASLYPEQIDHVEFYRQGHLEDTAYDEPYLLNYVTTWLQESVEVEPGEEWLARVKLRNGDVIEKRASC